MEFIRNNALLIGLALASGLMLLWPMLNRSSGGATNVTVNQAVMLMNSDKVLVLDVRDVAEFEKGHINGAVHIPVAELTGRLKELQKYKDKAILVNCQAGMRSAKACSILRAAEFSKIYNLQGGLEAWEKAKLPIISVATKG